MQAGFVIEGAKELERNLATLGATMHRKIAKQAVNAALNPLLRKARANAKSRVGGEMGALLADHIIKAKPKKGQKAGQYTLHVQMESDAPEFVHESQRTGKKTYIPAAIEYGHGMDKDQAARPFMRPAADATREDTIRLLARELRTRLMKYGLRQRYG